MKASQDLTDGELKLELQEHGYSCGPITGTTRRVLEKKLDAFRGGSDTISTTKTKGSKAAKAPKKSPVKKATSIPKTASDSASKGTASDSPKAASKNTIVSRPLDVIHFDIDESDDDSAVQSIPETVTSRKKTTGGVPTIISPAAPASAYNRQNAQSMHNRLSTGTSTSYGRMSTSSTTTEKHNMSSMFSDRGVLDDEEDDHMESSRIIPPSNRFGSVVSPVKRQTPKRYSIDKIADFGKQAWGYFSRPMHSSTPCSDEKYKYVTYKDDSYFGRPSKYRRSDIFNKSSVFTGAENSIWVLLFLVAFVFCILIAYGLHAHPEITLNAYTTVKDLVNGIYLLSSYAVFPIVATLVVLIGIGLAYQFYIWYRAYKLETKRRLMALVDSITDIIQENQTGIPEHHVRDILIPPTKRTSEDYKLWRQAADFINTEDSRVRTEIRLIDGIESNVWIWSTHVTGGWAGSAISGGTRIKVPENAFSLCLKLRGFDWADSNEDEERLRNSLLHKMFPIVPNSICFTRSCLLGQPECVVYMQLKNRNEAKEAFSAFHSHWFNGNLITVKYIPDERYAQRFPNVFQENARRNFFGF